MVVDQERDEEARPESEWNVVEARPESVATGRDLPAIASASDRVWHSNRGRPNPSALSGAHASRIPKSIRVTRAGRTTTAPTGDDWMHEVEIRGQRLLCRIDAGHAVLLDDGGSDRTDEFPALVAAARALPLHDALIDGVATALGSGGDTSADRPADTLYVFDLMHLDGYDLTQAPLVERKRLLKEVVEAAGQLPHLRFVDHITGRGAETFAAARRLGAPGLVSKKADSPYRPGPKPSRWWRVVPCVEGVDGSGIAQRATSKRRATTSRKAGKDEQGLARKRVKSAVKAGEKAASKKRAK